MEPEWTKSENFKKEMNDYMLFLMKDVLHEAHLRLQPGYDLRQERSQKIKKIFHE